MKRTETTKNKQKVSIAYDIFTFIATWEYSLFKLHLPFGPINNDDYNTHGTYYGTTPSYDVGNTLFCWGKEYKISYNIAYAQYDDSLVINI